MTNESPNAAPHCDTISTQRSSGSAVLAWQSRRSAGGASSRVPAAGVPRPSAPWHDLHHAWNSAAPESGGGGVWMAKTNATAGKSNMRSPQLGGVVQLGRAAIGLPHDVFDRRGEELVAEHDGLSIHEHIAYVARARRVHHQRHGIADRRVEMPLAEVADDEVGAAAGGERGDKRLEGQWQRDGQPCGPAAP